MPPFANHTNNRILSPNARTVDVAKHMMRDVIPVQQQKYANAFEIQGFETIVYHRLQHGIPCSCQNHRGASAHYLDEEGKMAPGAMDSLLSGGLEFRIDRYAGRTPTRPDFRTTPSRFEDGQLLDGDETHTLTAAEIVSNDLSDPMATAVSSEVLNGVNGESNSLALDDESAIFDGEAYHNDTRCAICFGSGYQGGFSVLNGARIVLSTQSPELTTLRGTKEYNQSPHAFLTDFVEFTVVLPAGALGIDSFRIWNNDQEVYPSTILIDGLPCSNALILALCNGRTHVLSLSWPELRYFTHVELQFNLSTKKALFEWPRTQEGTDLSRQDGTDDLGLYASPQVPRLNRQDVLAESVYNKILILQSSNPWNDNLRNMLGWDLQVRVIQPSELLNLLPRRSLTYQPATNLVHDNQDGPRRT